MKPLINKEIKYTALRISFKNETTNYIKSIAKCRKLQANF